MPTRQRHYSKEELARRGQALYESCIQQQVEAGNEGKIVAIDIETGGFEVDDIMWCQQLIDYLSDISMHNLG